MTSNSKNSSTEKNKLLAQKILLAFLFLAIGISIGVYIKPFKADKYTQLLEIIKRDYVDSIDIENIEENNIEHLLSLLDPHSSYIPPAFTQINARQIAGKYDGLGIEYIFFNDTLVVYNVFDKSPAKKRGIKAGDRILKANGHQISDTLKSNKISEYMYGEDGKESILLIYRKSTNKIIEISVPKETIVLNSSSIFYMVNSHLGYIKLDRFSSNTHAEFLKSFNELKKQGLKELILDLRNNGGGLLSEAVAIANEFLENESMISYTKGRNRRKNIYKADGKGAIKKEPLILLINHNTASASEILAGALQDNDRAVIIGNRSFGKGLVQEPYNLIDGSAVRLTISRYYTPSGRSIQKPYNEDVAKYRNEIYKRNNLNDTLNPAYDSTISKKFFTKNGRLLTSNGGIRPDVILRDTITDSTEIETLLPGLFYSRVIDIYLMDYMEAEIEFCKKQYKTELQFDQLYQVNEVHVKKLISVANKIPYLKNLVYSKKVSAIIKKNLKASIALKIYGEKGKSIILNTNDGIFSKTIEVLKNYNNIINPGKDKKTRFDY